jgi:hypothetical protein
LPIEAECVSLSQQHSNFVPAGCTGCLTGWKSDKKFLKICLARQVGSPRPALDSKISAMRQLANTMYSNILKPLGCLFFVRKYPEAVKMMIARELGTRYTVSCKRTLA